jgi:hypothetical protein
MLIEEIEHFGVCPICHKTDGFANAGKSHRFYCRKHRVSWGVGSNLFSSWRNQTEEEQRRIWNEIGLNDFEDVEPHHPVTLRRVCRPAAEQVAAVRTMAARESGGPCGPAEIRVGRDGKNYPAKSRREEREIGIEDEPGIEDEIEPGNYRTAFLIRADQAVAFAAYSGRISREVVEAARAAARAWNELVTKLENRIDAPVMDRRLG